MGENIDTLQGAVAAFQRGDKEMWWRLNDAGVEAVPVGEWPEAEVRGRDAVWELFQTVEEPWEPGAYRLEEITESHDRIAARMRRSLRGKGSGVEVEYDYWIVVTFREGKILRTEWFADRSDAFDAAGVSE